MTTIAYDERANEAFAAWREREDKSRARLSAYPFLRKGLRRRPAVVDQTGRFAVSIYSPYFSDAVARYELELGAGDARHFYANRQHLLRSLGDLEPEALTNELTLQLWHRYLADRRSEWASELVVTVPPDARSMVQSRSIVSIGQIRTWDDVAWPDFSIMRVLGGIGLGVIFGSIALLLISVGAALIGMYTGLFVFSMANYISYRAGEHRYLIGPSVSALLAFVAGSLSLVALTAVIFG